VRFAAALEHAKLAQIVQDGNADKNHGERGILNGPVRAEENQKLVAQGGGGKEEETKDRPVPGLKVNVGEVEDPKDQQRGAGPDGGDTREETATHGDPLYPEREAA
jgi:hypothetical protein